MLSPFAALFPSELLPLKEGGPSRQHIQNVHGFCCCGIARNACVFSKRFTSVHACLFLNLFAFCSCGCWCFFSSIFWLRLTVYQFGLRTHHLCSAQLYFRFVRPFLIYSRQINVKDTSAKMYAEIEKSEAQMNKKRNNNIAI